MINITEILKECSYKTSRSSGAGGQHVNKVSSKVELLWHLPNSNCVSETQKEVIQQKLANRISSEGFVSIVVQETRSQHKNKELAFQKLMKLLQQALTPKIQRKATQIPKQIKEKRLQVKRISSEIKANRKKISW